MKNRKIKFFEKTAYLMLTAFMTLLIIGLLPAGNSISKTTGEITIDISLPTVQCGMCERNISKALDKVSGVKVYEVDIEGKKVSLTYDDAITSLSQIETAISMAGYDANSTKANKKAYDKLSKCCKMPEDR